MRGGVFFLTVDVLFLTRPRVHTRPLIGLTQRPAASKWCSFTGTLCVKVVHKTLFKRCGHHVFISITLQSNISMTLNLDGK